MAVSVWPSLRRSELHAKTGNMELMDGTLKDGSEQAALEAKLAVVKAANGNIISADYCYYYDMHAHCCNGTVRAHTDHRA